MGSVWCGTVLAKNVGTLHQQKNCGPSGSCKMQEMLSKSETGGMWQHETPHTEEPELWRHSTDLRFEGSPMRQAYNAEKSGDWGTFATFRVARLTLQTRKLWLIGVATNRDARYL